MKTILQIVLWVLIIFFGFKLYQSIMGPVKFNKVKEERYRKVISKLKDIKAAQEAHQDVVGGFEGDFNKLIRFIDTAQFAITSRRDSSYADTEKNRAYGISEGYYIDVIVTDTLGFRSVKDSIFKGSDRYKTMMNVPDTDKKFTLKVDKVTDGKGVSYPVFEAKVSKDLVLADQNKDLLLQEKQVNTVDGVRGKFISVGALDKVSTSGNWSKVYESVKNE